MHSGPGHATPQGLRAKAGASRPSHLRAAFSRFLKRRHRLGHFGRHPLQDALAGRGNADALPGVVAQDLLAAARDEPAEALLRLRSRQQGLSTREAAARLARHGPNLVEHEGPLTWWRHLWNCFLDPFNLLLTALGTISWATHDLKATVVIGTMVALSTALRFVQEHRSSKAAERLKNLVSNTATVLRQLPLEVAVSTLVPSDSVLLAAGDMIPADCRVLAARDLFIAQAALTGESLPVEKFAHRPAALQDTDPLTQANLIFMGTNVVSGTATALVVHTGARTFFGALAAHATATQSTPNAFQAGINSVSWLLIRFAAVMVPVVLLVNGFTKGDWMEALLFSLAVAVGLTPEMLPMIVTSTLAKGAVNLARLKVIVKRLDAIQNLGAMDVLCTDKTGTLTQDRIALARHIDPLGQPSDEVLALAFINSHYQSGLKNLLDRAILDHVEMPAELKLEERYRKVDEVPFDFERRRMSVVVAERHNGQEHHELICKGALEEVLAVCTQVRLAEGTLGQGASVVPLDDHLLAQAQQVSAELSRSGLRVVAVAMKELPPHQLVYGVHDEAELVLVGYVAFLDPTKESAAPALRALSAHGVAIKVLTGDNAQVAAHVCAEVGLADGAVLLGHQVTAMTDAELATAVQTHRVFAKLAPLDKERIVRALRAQGHVVGFMGDGINDAPALHAADLGISVDSAVDIAKEAADIILLDKSLLVLDEGVIEGRTTFCNLLKYIRMAASSNFGNVLSVLVASAFLPFLPMLPLHLLVQNLLYDFSQTGIPFDRVDEDLVRAPLQWHAGDIGRFMLCFGPASSVFDLCAFAVMWWALEANGPEMQGLFQSGWFVVGLLTQTLIVHMIRTPKLPWFESRASGTLTALTAAVMGVGLWLPAGPLAHYFKLQPLPAAFYLWLAGLLLGYALLTTALKRWYVQRFGWQ